MRAVLVGLLMVVTGLLGPALLLPPMFDPWTLLAAWGFLILVILGGLTMARGMRDEGWLE